MASKSTASGGTAAKSAAARPSARERLLSAADELFYKEGIHTVGIDRVIEQAGVAKASLYNTFGSKEALIRAYLEARQDRISTLITGYIARYDEPRDRLLGVFEAQGSLFAAPGYRGCAFMNAGAEANPGDLVVQASEEYRSWIRQLLTDLSEQAGAPDPAGLARRLHMIYDGGSLSARMDHDPAVADVSRATAAALLDAALARGRESGA